MELNNKDKIILNNFLKQVNSSNDKEYKLYSFLIVEFIDHNYKSSDNPSYDIDDFIQEAFFILYSNKEETENVNTVLSNLYNKMNNKEEQSNIISIDLEKYIENIKDIKQKELLKTIVTNGDIVETAKRLKISYKELNVLLIVIRTELKKVIKFAKTFSEPNKRK